MTTGKLLVPSGRPTSTAGWSQRLLPNRPDWTYVGFDARRLSAGASMSAPAEDRERLVLVLEGGARVRVGATDFGILGSRDSVFAEAPAPLVLAAPGQPVEVTADRPSLIAIASAPAGEVRRTASVAPEDVLVETRGTGMTQRRIHHLLPPRAEAGRLIAFEVYTPGGNWSSYPPHKHDTEDPPREALLQELYFFRFTRPTGFAVQRVYTSDRSIDETVTAHDGDIVLVPAGYHVVGAAAGYDCYYLNIMAGPARAWHFTVDPDHLWLMDWDPTDPKV